jgi:tetratricopeptide (TPR) repeat protein
VAVLAASPSSFCGAASAEESLTYLETAGRYADLQAEAEHRLSSGQKANATLLSYLCISYSRLKQYAKLFDCTDRLDEETRRGDFEMALDSKWMFVASSDARPMSEVLRARAYFELGDYPKAIASGNRALDQLGAIPNTGGLSLYPKVRYEIMALAVIGVCAVQIGDQQMAKSMERRLQKVSLPMLGLRMWLWTKNAALTQVYMAMHQYNDALKHIPDELPAVMSLMISGQRFPKLAGSQRQKRYSTRFSLRHVSETWAICTGSPYSNVAASRKARIIPSRRRIFTAMQWMWSNCSAPALLPRPARSDSWVTSRFSTPS